MLELKPVSTMSMFSLGEKTYYANGSPIEVFICTGKKDDGRVWWSRTNLSQDIATEPPKNFFADIESAFLFVKEYARHPDYQYAVVKDFSGEGIAYYDKKLVFTHFKTRKQEMLHLAKKKLKRWKRKTAIGR